MMSPTTLLGGASVSWRDAPAAPVVIVAVADPNHGWTGVAVRHQQPARLLDQLARARHADPTVSLLTHVVRYLHGTRDVLEVRLTPSSTTRTARDARWLLLDTHATLELRSWTPRRDGTRVTRTVRTATYTDRRYPAMTTRYYATIHHGPPSITLSDQAGTTHDTLALPDPAPYEPDTYHDVYVVPALANAGWTLVPGTYEPDRARWEVERY